MSDVRIRAATPDDVPRVVELILGLAEYEKLAHECRAEAGRLREHLFGERPVCEALVAEVAVDDGPRAIGFALHFTAYSTFWCAPFLYLEDLFVEPEWRGHGAGKALLAALAARAIERGCPRLQWAVLDWNQPAIAFYRTLGAELMDSWRTCRLDGEALQRLAEAAG